MTNYYTNSRYFALLLTSSLLCSLPHNTSSPGDPDISVYLCVFVLYCVVVVLLWARLDGPDGIEA